MRTTRLLPLILPLAALLACSPEETAVLPRTSGASPDLTGGVGKASPSPDPGPTPSPSPTAVPVLQSLTVVPASFTLSSDPMASFAQRDMALALVATLSNGRQVSTSASWSASPAGRVSVSSTGYVSAIVDAPSGPVTLTASSGSITATAIATITSRALAVSYVTLAPNALTLYKPAANGSSLPEYPTHAALSPTVVMSDLSTTSAVAWSVSDPSVATVSLTGVVSALAAGACTVEARARSDASQKAACQLTVTAKGAVAVTVE